MNEYKGIFIGGVTAAVLLAGSFTQAQQQTVADQDLLNLLETVDAQSAKTPVDRTKDTLEIAAAHAVGANEVLIDSVSSDTNSISDVLEIISPDQEVASRVGDLISVSLRDVGLEEAISLFAELAEANIIIPELTEAARISVNLKDVEWRPALQSILDAYNYELYQRVSGSNVYSVRRRSPDAVEPQVVETFKLRFATVPNAAKLIRDLLPEEAKVSEFASRNMLVVKSTESSLSEIRAVLSSIDQIRQQVFIESKFMELSDDAQKNLGVNWSSLESYGASASVGTATYGSESTSGTVSENLFTDLTGGSGTFAGNGEYSILTSVLDADEFSMALSALEQSQGVNIVSNPKIIVANEEKANISIIRKEPNLKQERQPSSSDGALDTITYEMDPEMPWFEFGIKLEVTPSINTSSNITVKINPALTRKYADKEAGENTYPVIDEKSIQTVFSLASGQTAAIGGLTEITESEEENKIPVLGSIPFLGRLFSWTETVSGQNETIIFVTVGLANTQEQLESVGMPEDAELSRRQIILDGNNQILRERDREYFEAEQQAKLNDMMKAMDRKEDERLDDRDAYLGKEASKDAEREAKNNS